MWNALFAFEDPARADEATSALVAAGFPSDGVKAHRRSSGRRGGAVEQVDEQVTGGVLTNLYDLFQGVFDWGESPHDASAYEAVVNRGGLVLEIRAIDQERAVVDEVVGPMAEQRTEWREEPK